MLRKRIGGARIRARLRAIIAGPGETRHAVSQAAEFCRSRPAPVRICWDLDNTLSDSGVLLRSGLALDDAIVRAAPVRNMLTFYETLSSRLPEAEHFILSARRRSMRPDTVRWMKRYGLWAEEPRLCLVPRAGAKVRIWRQLARDAALVIIDDLSFDHERESPSLYRSLIRRAEGLAVVYVGLDQIAEIVHEEAMAYAMATRIQGSVEGFARPREYRFR